MISLLAALTILCTCLGPTVVDAADHHDPVAYARLFENNLPMFEEVAHLVKDFQAESVLDLGTGPGEPATLIAKALPNSKVVATDLQEGMLEMARARGRGLKNIEYQVVSADDLSAFADSSFDAVTMIYCLMFVPDKQKTLSEIARVLKPGGRAYIAVWKDSGYSKVVHEAVSSVMGQPAPTPQVNPMALSAENVVESLVAGVDKLKVTATLPVSYKFLCGKTAEEVCAGGNIVAGSQLAKLEKAGSNTAKEDFCRYFMAALEGSYTEDAGYAIQANKAQLLTVQKEGHRASAEL